MPSKSVFKDETLEGDYGSLHFRLIEPALFSNSPEVRRAIVASVRRVNRDFTRNLVRRIQSALTLKNYEKSMWTWKFIDSWHVESTAAARQGEYFAGVWSDDERLPYYEYSHHPSSMPDSRPGTPIDIWVKGLLENPQGDHKRPIRPYQVAQSIAREGVKGKQVVNKVVDSVADEYGQLIDAAMRRAMDVLSDAS